MMLNEWCRKKKETRLQTAFSVLLFQISISHLSNVYVQVYLKPPEFPLASFPELLLTNTFLPQSFVSL